jgi:hypothetical protein
MVAFLIALGALFLAMTASAVAVPDPLRSTTSVIAAGYIVKR